MLKKSLAMLIIYFGSGTLLYLDFMNKQVQNSSAQLHQDVLGARVEANRRIEYARIEMERKNKAREFYENQALIDLTRCQVAAEKSNNDFMDIVEKDLSGKPDFAAIEQTFMLQLGKLKDDAYTECKRVYDNLLRGQV